MKNKTTIVIVAQIIIIIILIWVIVLLGKKNIIGIQSDEDGIRRRDYYRLHDSN